jgi:glycosyltransferase involved in cell wall biosynthesis
MRTGLNPYKGELGKNAAYIPKDITVCMLTFIPDISGWFRERFDILKLSLESLFKHTEPDYDLLIFDNGSCKTVTDYFLGLKESGLVNYLFLNKDNLGVVGGLNFIFSAAPGKYIAFTPDDMFFHPGWMNACLKIIENYPDVGYVTACPAIHSFNTPYTSYSIDLPEAHKKIKTLKSKWKREWDVVYANNAGGNIDDYVQKYAGVDVPLYVLNGVEAYPLGIHTTFLMKKDVARDLLPFPLHGNAMGGAPNDPYSFINVFDKAINDRKLATLTTPGLYTETFGNKINSRAIGLLNKYDINLDRLDVKKRGEALSFNQKLLVMFFKFPFLRKLPQRAISFFDNVVYYKKVYNINKSR